MIVRMKLAGAACACYGAAIVAANWLTENYGIVPVGFGLTATAGTFAAGAALLLRDFVQETAGRIAVLAGVLAGALLTLAISPHLAVASATAFLVAELADMAIYTPLRTRGWARAVIASNIVGAIIDTYLFLWLADFPVTTDGVTGQLLGKVLYATAIPVALVFGVRAVRRHTVES